MSDNQPVTDGFGLDKARRLRAETDQGEEEQDQLDPSFPYIMIPLDPEFFGL